MSFDFTTAKGPGAAAAADIRNHIVGFGRAAPDSLDVHCPLEDEGTVALTSIVVSVGVE